MSSERCYGLYRLCQRSSKWQHFLIIFTYEYESTKNVTTQALTVLRKEVSQPYPFWTFWWVTSERQTGALFPRFPFTSPWVSSNWLTPLAPLFSTVFTYVRVYIGNPFLALDWRPPQVSARCWQACPHNTTRPRLASYIGSAHYLGALLESLIFSSTFVSHLSICLSLDFFWSVRLSLCQAWVRVRDKIASLPIHARVQTAFHLADLLVRSAQRLEVAFALKSVSQSTFLRCGAALIALSLVFSKGGGRWSPPSALSWIRGTCAKAASRQRCARNSSNPGDCACGRALVPSFLARSRFHRQYARSSRVRQTMFCSKI